MNTIPHLLLGLALSAFVLRAAVAAEGRVAALVEDGLPAYGGTPALPAFKMVETLGRHGIRAQAVSADEAANPAILNAQRFAVLVKPYGNAFPKPSLANLRAFHAAGGCLVLNGVPFTHPCDKVDGKWKDLGHVNYFGHDANGVGTGGFGGPLPKEKEQWVTVAANPLGLRPEMLPNDRGRLQWLIPRSLAVEDEVIPVVNVGLADGEPHPASALIRHGCAGFKGARDVWIGQVASGRDEADRFLAEQLLVRGVLWCQLEKGELSADDFRARLATLDQMPKPGPLPGNLPLIAAPRPWGDTFLPKSNPPARRLRAVNVGPLKPEERIALTCLQGLTSREQPRLWLVRIPDDQAWLDWHKQKGHIDGYEWVQDWAGLFREFAGVCKGAVVPDAQLYRGDLLAANVAACEDLIMATPKLAQKLGLSVKLDLRGRFTTYADGMRWVWTSYRDRLSRHLCNFMHPRRLRNCTFAYDLQWRGVMFWIAGTLDEREAGADRFAERQLMAEILAEMAPNVAVLGFPYAGEGVGPGEPEGVALASRYAKGLVCTDNLANTCVMSGVRIERLSQPQPPPAPPLERDKVYISLVMSDGDNLNTWMRFYKGYFEHPSFGQFPLAFGLGPPIRELMPVVAQWYYEHATPTTEFIADVSGAAYIQPEKYGLAYGDRERVLDGFLDWTARLMPPMGLRTVRTVSGGDKTLSRYAQALPFCHSLFADMGRYSGREGIQNLTYSLPDGTPVFRAATSWRYGKDGFLKELREQVGERRPAFVNGFVHCWTFRMDDLVHIWEQRAPDMVFVTPTQLAQLYRQAREHSQAPRSLRGQETSTAQATGAVK